MRNSKVTSMLVVLMFLLVTGIRGADRYSQ